MRLMQISVHDNAGHYYNPIVFSNAEIDKSTQFNFPQALFFLSFILLVAIALMDLLAAIIVEGSFERTRADVEIEEENRNALLKRILPQFFMVFRDTDLDGSGEIQS